MEDRSLDDFVGVGTSDEEAGPSDEEAGSPEKEAGSPEKEAADTAEPDAADSDTEASEIGGEGAKGADGESAIEPATATARVDPEGAACPECGERAERRWRTDDGEFVCAACKGW